MSETALYISPHPDDAVLSCAGGILRRRDEGRRVVVCTVFTQGPPATRRREDEKALSSVGVDWLHLGLDDALWREKLEPSFEQLALRTPIRHALVAVVHRMLSAVVAQLEPSEVFLPLGVGGHVDHRTVFAARRAAGPNARFYEERPYAFVPALRALRTLELEGGTVRKPPAAEDILRQFEEGGCRAFLSGRERKRCAEELAAKLRKREPLTELKLVVQTNRFPKQLLSRAVALIDAYPSQSQWLFGRSGAARVWGSQAAAGSGWFEREVALGR